MIREKLLNIRKILMKKFISLLTVLLLTSALTSCQTPEESSTPSMRMELFEEKKNAFGNIEAPSDFDWKQCDGIILDFIVENNINANILSKECDKFTNVTGIKVNIKSMDFNTMTEKINMEFISKTGRYELIYVDPYQTLNRFHEELEDLNRFEDNPDIPHIVGGLDSFSPAQTEVCSYFQTKDKLCAIPFDSTTMIFFYRKDIFEKYGDAMQQDLGYDSHPGSSSFTWEHYIEVSEWIDVHVPKNEIRYASLTMSAAHNSIYTEFSNVLNSYGGDYFADKNVNTLGIPLGSTLLADSDAFIKALEIYQKIAYLDRDNAGKFNWTEGADIFKNGEAAMMLNWDENAPALENSRESMVAGNVGYAVLPYGSVRSANIYGGSGIGINSNTSEEKKLAAWLFIVWATSPQLQINAFLEDQGGNMPTRTNLNHLITGQYMAKLPHASATITAQKKSFAYYRPKIEKGYEFENMMITNLTQMIHDNLSAMQTAQNMQKDWDNIREG